ncbi:unnamed protein product [Rotaria sordida]|uniref:Uncharacterized protein n=1 Tax=Rotaria sordida TaxID=392033 RepID=A0A816C3F3_9BILA|nr:unnamed protein product [Rotaria sordida]CAF1618817.1 unnamed protein product [Rotaria sordida]
MKNNLSKITYIAITAEFWSDKKQNSYLGLTAHYRHYSSIIGRVIEKQLTELQIFNKVTTITCDGAPNIVGLFDYFSRTGINRINNIEECNQGDNELESATTDSSTSDQQSDEDESEDDEDEESDLEDNFQ